MEKAKKPSVFKTAGDQIVRYYKKVRYARFVPFYILIWASFGARLFTAQVCQQVAASGH